jgi:hypothetical protein
MASSAMTRATGWRTPAVVRAAGTARSVACGSKPDPGQAIGTASDQQPVAWLPGWDRPVVVDAFGDDQVLEQVQVVVVVAFRGDPGGFGGGVHVERGTPPARVALAPGFGASTPGRR